MQIPLNSRFYVAGHRGLVGSALLRLLEKRGYTNLLLRTHDELELRDSTAVSRFFHQEKPEYVVLAAAKVGGIVANSTYPADFLADNLAIGLNIVHAAAKTGVKKLLNLGSSCIYPRLAPQPMQESALLTGPLESTNRAYAIAKIATIELCDQFRAQYGCDFISAMPTNLYGPGDNFDLEKSHVIPAMIRKFHNAVVSQQSEVHLWGTGNVRREFLYVSDLAEACLFLLEHFSDAGPINVGVGEDVTIRELAELLREQSGFRGTIIWDTSKPDGTPRKLLDVHRLNSLGFSPLTTLRQGLQSTGKWYQENHAHARG